MKIDLTDQEASLLRNHVIAACSSMPSDHPDYATLQSVRQKLQPPIKVGQRFRHENGESWILARVGMNEVVLISLKNGDCLRTFIKVVDIHDISDEEWAMIAAYELFTREDN